MKQFLLIALLLACSISTFSQLTEGRYKILAVKGFLNNETIFENPFKDGVAEINVTNELVTIVIGGYPAFVFSIEKPMKKDDSYLYDAFEIQSGLRTNLISHRDKEYPQIDGGMLFVKRSDEYSDIFFIVKD